MMLRLAILVAIMQSTIRRTSIAQLTRDETLRKIITTNTYFSLWRHAGAGAWRCLQMMPPLFRMRSIGTYFVPPEQAKTYTIEATWWDDPEEFWTVAFDEKGWTTFTEGAENVGLLFAGKSEFPWLVDIRVERRHQEYWSTGNLINSDTVFTTCRAILDLGDFKLGTDTPRVTFAQLYLFEYTQRENPTDQDWLFGGSRNVLDATKHRWCNIQQNYYDGGIITLTKPIIPAPPTISTMPLSFNYREGRLGTFDLRKMAEQRRVCYVASFGRDSANIRESLVKDFKVKYRVYWERPNLCYQYAPWLCPNRLLGPSACVTGTKSPDVEGKELMCFKSRAKVGAVCDHDKGAPLVCDGRVYGLVIMGARIGRCNNLLSLPFWVQKISMFVDYFEPTEEGGSGREVQFKTRTASSSAVSFFKSDTYHRVLLMVVPIIHYLLC